MPWVAPVLAVVGTVVSVGGSLLSAGAQASAMNAQAAAQQQQAENTRAIAQYNADIQRQNVEVNYKLALYQAQNNAMLANVSQAAAINNMNMALLQAGGARQQYNQQLENEKQKQMEAAATRAQARDAADRQRQENSQKLSQIRSKYAASGVTFEGTPLEVLADAARIGESAAQDIAYVGELQSRKEYREASIERFKGEFALLEEKKWNVEAQNLKNQASRFSYEASLYEFDSAIAGAQKQIGYNKARLTELAGAAEAQGYEFAAQQSTMAAGAARIGAIGGIGKGISGLAGAASYMYGGKGGFGGTSTSGSGGYLSGGD
jgi:hypothetical protein